MNNRSWLLVIAVLGLTVLSGAGITSYNIQKLPEFPEEVNKVLQNSCFGCHTTDARSEDAKAAMDFNIWDEYKLTKKISLLNKIDVVLKESSMPPERMLKRFPERALSDDQVKLIRDWAQNETKKLMK